MDSCRRAIVKDFNGDGARASGIDLPLHGLWVGMDGPLRLGQFCGHRHPDLLTFLQLWDSTCE